MSSINPASMERHLKKIYDCLNIGCNKKAVQEVDRLPKNIRDLSLFKALKSLALIRMGKRRQAFDILDKINPNDDLDEVTLQTMTSCYKESVDTHKIVDLYEAASLRKPKDPEIMDHLFMAHVRIFNFKRQKEIALQMYKTFSKKKRLHSFWAIMSLVMQAQGTADRVKSTPQDETDKRVCLSLAEKMCEKMIDNERTNEEIELYLIILRKQNKSEEEYKFLTGPVGLRTTDHLSWFNRRRAFLCLDLRMYSRAFKHYFPTLIQDYPDQLEYYQGLFKSAFLLDCETPSQQQQQTQPVNAGTPVKSSSALAECYDIVERQCALALELDQSKGKSHQNSSKSLSRASSVNPNCKRLLRGPFMAKIELFNMILSNVDTLPSNIYEMSKSKFAANQNMNQLLLDYFQNFSRKIICYYDLEYLINLIKLSDEDKKSFIEMVGNFVKENKPSNELDGFYVELNYELLKFAVLEFNSDVDRVQMARRYIGFYDKYSHLGRQFNKTEFLPGDSYCLLIANSILVKTPDSEVNDSIAVSLILILENAIVNSPSNHQLKISLLKLYSLIGASRPCSELLLALDIKHFQIDSLGHLLNPVLYNTGNYNLSKESLEACQEFYTHGGRECFEGLTASYRDGRFSKIEEISNLLKRLSNSLNAAQCFLLQAMVNNLSANTIEELTTASQSFDPSRFVNFETIRDNRDLKVIRTYHYETNAALKQKQIENFQDEKLWIRLRFCLLKSVYLQLKNESSQEMKSEFELLKAQIAELKPSSQLCFDPELAPVRWSYIDLDQLISLVDPLIFLADPQELTTTDFNKYCATIDAIMMKLEQRLSSIDTLVKTKQTLSSLTITLEVISICGTSLISLSNRSKSRSVPHQMMNKTEAQLTKLSNLIKGVDTKASVLDKLNSAETSLLSGGISSMNGDRRQANFLKIKEKIAGSYSESFREIEGTCRRKTKLFRLSS